MAPGTLLRIYQHLQRIGISGEVAATGDHITIRTAALTACYDPAEATRLAQQAPSWRAGQQADEILW